VHGLQRALQAEGVCSRSGTALGRGALFHLLKNRIYLGEITHKGQSYPGQQAPIMSVKVFDQVQAKLEMHRRARCSHDAVAGNAPLTGRLFDVAGSPMSPSFTRKRSGRIYRYYVSSPLQQGRQRQATSLRISAPVLEEAVRVALMQANEVHTDTSLGAVLGPVRRIDVLSTGLCLTIDRAKSPRPLRGQLKQHTEAALGKLHVPLCLRDRGSRTWAHVPQGSGAPQKDPVLIAGLRKAHRLAAAAGWQLDGIVKYGSCSAPKNTYERSLVRLAFLAPQLQKSILDGRQPANITLEQLVRGGVPIGWREQATMFGTKAHLPTAWDRPSQPQS
jgi:hypothetical protein